MHNNWFGNFLETEIVSELPIMFITESEENKNDTSRVLG